MRISTVIICASVIGGMLALAGCGHKLVAHNGESTVAVYPDEDTFTKLVDLKKQGGVGGMIGGLGEGLTAKQVDNNTPVRIIRSDDKGSQVEVLDGAFKGLTASSPTTSTTTLCVVSVLSRPRPLRLSELPDIRRTEPAEETRSRTDHEIDPGGNRCPDIPG